MKDRVVKIRVHYLDLKGDLQYMEYDIHEDVYHGAVLLMESTVAGAIDRKAMISFFIRGEEENEEWNDRRLLVHMLIRFYGMAPHLANYLYESWRYGQAPHISKD